MRAPFSFLSPGRLVCLALLAPCLALAQSSPPILDPAGAANPAAATAPLAYQGIPPRPVQAQQLGAQDWSAANTAVGAFPRGHADIVGWEAAQARAGAGAAPSTLPAAETLHGSDPAAGHAIPSPGAHPHSMHPQQHQKGQP